MPSFSPLQLYSEEERSLFLGDLSCFCQEQDVYDFFRGVGEIASIRLVRSKTTNKCLGYGFITFVDIHVLFYAMQLNGEVLLGRRMKIGLANPPKTSLLSRKNAGMKKEMDRPRLNKKDIPNSSAQLHFSYLSQQVRFLVTEETIRNIFSQFGEVDDVIIKKSSFDSKSQNGYGFVHFLPNGDGLDAAIRAASVITQVVIDDVLYDSCLSRSLEATLNYSSRRFLSQEKTIAVPSTSFEQKTFLFSEQKTEKMQFPTYYQQPHVDHIFSQHLNHVASPGGFRATDAIVNHAQIRNEELGPFRTASSSSSAFLMEEFAHDNLLDARMRNEELGPFRTASSASSAFVMEEFTHDNSLDSWQSNYFIRRF